MRLVGLVTSTEVPAVEPKSTVVAPVTKPVPVTVTEVPPVWGPLVGLTAGDRRRTRCRCRRWPAAWMHHRP